MQFQRVIANPPFSQNYNRANMLHPDRFIYGFAPETGKKADLMFVQHMLASLQPNGKMAVVMPHGVLFRGGKEKEIRTTDFDLTVEERDALYQNGISAARQFLQRWDFEAWKKKYRQPVY